MITVPGWNSSNRRSELPPDWDKRRARRFKHDGYRCTWTNVYDERCNGPAEECDHKVPGPDHSHENLRSLCSYHHGIKSGQEGAAARSSAWRQNNQKFRRREQHPGAM